MLHTIFLDRFLIYIFFVFLISALIVAIAFHVIVIAAFDIPFFFLEYSFVDLVDVTSHLVVRLKAAGTKLAAKEIDFGGPDGIGQNVLAVTSEVVLTSPFCQERTWAPWSLTGERPGQLLVVKSNVTPTCLPIWKISRAVLARNQLQTCLDRVVVLLMLVVVSPPHLVGVELVIAVVAHTKFLATGHGWEKKHVFSG